MCIYVNPSPANSFWVLKMSSAAYIQVYLILNFVLDAKTMNPDQAALLVEVLSGSILVEI